MAGPRKKPAAKKKAAAPKLSPEAVWAERAPAEVDAVVAATQPALEVRIDSKPLAARTGRSLELGAVLASSPAEGPRPWVTVGSADDFLHGVGAVLADLCTDTRGSRQKRWAIFGAGEASRALREPGWQDILRSVAHRSKSQLRVTLLPSAHSDNCARSVVFRGLGVLGHGDDRLTLTVTISEVHAGSPRAPVQRVVGAWDAETGAARVAEEKRPDPHGFRVLPR